MSGTGTDGSFAGAPGRRRTLRAGRAWLLHQRALGASALGLCALVSGCTAGDGDALPTAQELALVPRPRALAIEAGAFALTDATRITVAAGAEGVGEGLADVLRPATGFAFDVVPAGAGEGDIALALDGGATLGGEGYTLAVSDAGVEVHAHAAAGLFYGTQTLRQLLPAALEARVARPEVAWTLPHVHIDDAPRFAWRGTMLDVARHFFGVAEVERFIDLAAYHKLNRVHLHLTDDQGWRVQIDAWPLLTEVGGQTEVGGGPGGFYTKADVAELVAYAEARFVTLVPEVDMPGHVNAALSAYGELDASGVAAAPYTGTDVGFSTLWLDGPATAGFASDVVAEVAAQFPGPWLHIGGDEANVTPAADYAAFIASLQPLVAAQQKTLVGWEEIGGAELTPPFLAQFWLADGKALAARDRGARIIASPAPYAYLDMKYDGATPVGQSYLGFTSVQKAYAWDPVMAGLGEEDVIGLEAPLWTETVASEADIDLLAYPRLAGHAEIAWSPADDRSFQEYRQRLARHGARLDALGVGFFRSPEIDWR